MSERMTVESEALTDEHCGFCGLHYGIHPRYKSLEHLARAVARDREAHEWMPPSTYAAVKQAILDEGLKEYQARVDGLADYVDGAATCEYDTIDGQPDMLVCATHQWMGTCPIDAIRTALAAVRESQVSQ